MNRPNPYEPPPDVVAVHSTRSAFFPPMLFALVAIILWAIFHTSAFGVFLPGVIGFAAAWWYKATPKLTIGTIALAYAIGLSAIILASFVSDRFLDPMWQQDDDLRPRVTRIWAVCGVIGAIGGAVFGVRAGQPKSRAGQPTSKG